MLIITYNNTDNYVLQLPKREIYLRDNKLPAVTNDDYGYLVLIKFCQLRVSCVFKRFNVTRSPRQLQITELSRLDVLSCFRCSNLNININILT